MSFLAKLQQVKQNAKINSPSVPIGAPRNTKANGSNDSLLPTNYVREVDPAIRRLKEARRLKQPILSETTRAKSSKTKTVQKEEKPVYKRTPGYHTSKTNVTRVPKHDPIKKLSFEELMKQAENKSKSVNKESLTDSRKKVPSTNKFKNDGRSKSKRLVLPPKKEGESKITVKSWSHIARPNAKLAKKLKANEYSLSNRLSRSNKNEYDEDLSDFIDDDEVDAGEYADHQNSYDRDEIWSIFHKGGKRKYYDDDLDDDMEANEMEILEEEEEAARMAKLEDKREAQWLKKHEIEKKRRRKD